MVTAPISIDVRVFSSMRASLFSISKMVESRISWLRRINKVEICSESWLSALTRACVFFS